MSLSSLNNTALVAGFCRKYNNKELYNRLSLHRSTMTSSQMHWSKLRTFGRVIGRFIRIYLDLKTYGSSRQCTEKHQVLTEKPLLHKNFVFLPRSPFKMIWNLLIVVLLLYTATILPYRVCFNLLQGHDWILLDFSVDLFFFLDILVNFNTGIISITEKVNFSRKDIAIQYFKTWFLIDFISCIPIDFIFGQNEGVSYNKLFRIFRVSRLYRLFKILKLLKLFRFVRSHYLESLTTSPKFKSTASRIVGFLLTLVLIVHISGCLWFYIGKIDDDQSANWIFRYRIDDLSDYDKYIASIYFVFTTLTTVGYGDITPLTNTEKFFTMILMVFGVGYYSFVIGSLSSSIKNSDQTALAIKTKYQGFKEFSKIIQLSPDIVSRVKHFIKLNLYKTYTENNHIEVILKDLPSNLREDLMTFMNSDIVNKFDYFKEKPKNFVNGLINHMILYSYSYMETLYEENEIPEEVHFIKSGRVMMKIRDDLIFRTFNEGSYFGEIEIFEDTYRDSTAFVGSKIADIYTLNKLYFLQILKDYEEIYEQTLSIAKIRKAKNDQCISEILEELCPQNDSLKTDSDDSSPAREESSGSYVLKRHDTAIMISLQHDNPSKQKNRELWQNALGAKKFQHGKTLKSKTSIDVKRCQKLKKPFYSRLKSLTDPVKIKRSIILKPKFEGRSSENTFDFCNEEMESEAGQSKEQESESLSDLELDCENIFYGIDLWQTKIEEQVIYT